VSIAEKQLDNLNYNLFVLFLILNTFPNEPPPKNSNLVYLNPNRSVPFESRTVCIFLFKVHYYKKIIHDFNKLFIYHWQACFEIKIKIKKIIIIIIIIRNNVSWK
jgi:hypothetical protein